MSAVDLIKAIKTMRDERVAERIAEGDLSVLVGLELTPEEKRMVRRVGTELVSEVSAYDATSATFEALAYVGREGVPRECEADLDEVIAFTIGASNPGTADGHGDGSTAEGATVHFDLATTGYKPTQPGGYVGSAGIPSP